MLKTGIEDEAFHRFLQKFNIEEQRALEAFYRELVGKRRIPYKIKDRKLPVNVQLCQGFAVNIEFQDVLIEDGRHPKELLMDNLRGEWMADGRARLIFMNRLVSQGEGSAVKESAFSFSALKAGIQLFDYKIHRIKMERNLKDLPWRLIYETLLAMDQKRSNLGEGSLNRHEKSLLEIFEFMGPFLKLYLAETTRIGFGKLTVLFDEALTNWNFDESVCRRGAEFFAALGFRHISSDFSKGMWQSRDFIQELLYTMRSVKGAAIYKSLAKQIDSAGKDYQSLSETDVDRSLFRSYVREKIQKVFAEHGWEGVYPSYRAVVTPEFVEMSSVYKRQYTYLNEKKKFLYFDFVETVAEDQYQMTPITGVVLPKNVSEDYRKMTSLDCFFVDGGRRNGEVFEDLTLTEGMSHKEIRERMEQLGYILDLQRGSNR